MSPTYSVAAPRRGKPGRPTKFNPKTVKRVLCCVEKGMPLSLASSAAGFSYTTLSDYRAKHPQFAEALKRSIAKGVEKRLKKIEDASDAGDWRASAWLLEHCQPEHFAKNRIELTGANGGPLAAGIGIYLPKKDAGAEPTIEINAVKQIADEH
jgi:hypothetical protein